LPENPVSKWCVYWRKAVSFCVFSAIVEPAPAVSAAHPTGNCESACRTIAFDNSQRDAETAVVGSNIASIQQMMHYAVDGNRQLALQ
jgi:hypothetical protein